MKEVESILEPITGYLISIERDTLNGWYFIKLGIPKSWVFNENDEICIEILSENETGKILKIFPKSNNVVIDDLIIFVMIIMNTNQKIAEKEKQFADQMEEMKKNLEKQANEFYKELDELKENSFKKLNDSFIVELKKESKLKKTKDKSEEKIDDVPDNANT